MGNFAIKNVTLCPYSKTYLYDSQQPQNYQ